MEFHAAGIKIMADEIVPMENSNCDEIDFRILRELDLNARISYMDISRKSGISPYTVNRRLESLEKRGVIRGYTCVTDLFRLGYMCYRMYFRLQHVNNTTEKEIMDYLVSSKLTTWCAYASGMYDMTAFLRFDKHMRAAEFWDDFMAKYRPYIKGNAIVPYCGDVRCCLPFLNSIGKSWDLVDGQERARINKTDSMILQMLVSNSRSPLEVIGNAVGLHPASVSYRIEKMIGKKVLKAFKPVVDMEVLGYRLFKVDFSLSSLQNKKKIEDSVVGKPGVSHILKTLGWADLELQVYAKSSKELSCLLHGIRDEFCNDVQDYDFFEYPAVAKDSNAGVLSDFAV